MAISTSKLTAFLVIKSLVIVIGLGISAIIGKWIVFKFKINPFPTINYERSLRENTETKPLEEYLKITNTIDKLEKGELATFYLIIFALVLALVSIILMIVSLCRKLTTALLTRLIFILNVFGINVVLVVSVVVYALFLKQAVSETMAALLPKRDTNTRRITEIIESNYTTTATTLQPVTQPTYGDSYGIGWGAIGFIVAVSFHVIFAIPINVIWFKHQSRNAENIKKDDIDNKTVVKETV